jgi:hypothetical protein
MNLAFPPTYRLRHRSDGDRATCCSEDTGVSDGIDQRTFSSAVWDVAIRSERVSPGLRA